MNKEELKIQALREALRDRVSSITDEYENKIADMRIEITLLNQALGELQSNQSQTTEEEPEPQIDA